MAEKMVKKAARERGVANCICQDDENAIELQGDAGRQGQSVVEKASENDNTQKIAPSGATCVCAVVDVCRYWSHSQL